MLSDSIWHGRRKKLKKKIIEDCFLKEALLGVKVKLGGSGYGYQGQNRCPEHWELVVSVDYVLPYAFVDIYSTLGVGEMHLVVLQLVCNWEFGYLAMQWRKEANADKKCFMIFQVLKQLVTVPAQLQSSGATLVGLV